MVLRIIDTIGEIIRGIRSGYFIPVNNFQEFFLNFIYGLGILIIFFLPPIIYLKTYQYLEKNHPKKYVLITKWWFKVLFVIFFWFLTIIETEIIPGITISMICFAIIITYLVFLGWKYLYDKNKFYKLKFR